LIVDRIVDVADRDLDGPANVVVGPSELGLTVYADGTLITVVTEADAELEGFAPNVIAKILAGEIANEDPQDLNQVSRSQSAPGRPRRLCLASLSRRFQPSKDRP